MKKKFLILLALILTCMFISLPSAFASEPRASYQISAYSITITPDVGEIDVEFTITGTNTMNKIGCESINLYASNGSSWRLVRSLDEDDAGMSLSNTFTHANLISVDTVAGIDYKIVVKVFAENDAGRDTRSETAYYTGR